MAGFCNPLTASRTVPLPAALARKCRQPYRADKNDSIKVIDLPAADSFVVVCYSRPQVS